MEYKYLLEVLRSGLYKEFYEDAAKAFIPFLNPLVYGRSPLENSSFLVSSAHEDQTLHGQGFVARLSGSTAEFLNIWLILNAGLKPFVLDAYGQLVLQFQPILPEWLFTKEKTSIHYLSKDKKWQAITLVPNTYAFNFMGSTLVVYHNPSRKKIFGEGKAEVSKVLLRYPNKKHPVEINSAIISSPHAVDIRNNKLERIDVYFSPPS
jgi:hypothetical protein